jgi:hypothetical protein
MLKYLKKIIGLSALVFLLLPILTSLSASAEGDSECLSQYTGTSNAFNVNAGINYFDSHTGSDAGSAADLSIVYGEGSVGLAPGKRDYAACLEAESGNAFENDFGGDYDYESRGWFWNDNWGFISMACENGLNDGGYLDGIVNCGSIDYGVYLGKKNAKGLRKLFGYGWSENTGWIKFRGQGQYPKDQGIFPYGVEMLPDGTLTGSAWTEAGVYLNFDGTKIILNGTPEAVPDNSGDGFCSDFGPGLCVEVTPDPTKISFEGVGDEAYKVADCEDGYYVELHFKDALGAPFVFLPPNNDEQLQQVLNLLGAAAGGGFSKEAVKIAAFMEGPFMLQNSQPAAAFQTGYGLITFNWKDTLKASQTLAGLGDYDFNLSSNPWTTTPANGAPQGAVVSKPLGFDDFEQALDADGDAIIGEYISKNPVASCAPTTDGNVSKTVSTSPSYTFSNEEFLNPIDGVGELSDNILELTSVSYTDIINSAGAVIVPAFTTTANNKLNLPLNFRPAVEVDTLYEGDLKDNFSAKRGLTNFFTFSLDAITSASTVLDVLGGPNATVKLALTYDQEATDASCPGGNGNFDFDFTEDFYGASANSTYITGVIEDLLDAGPVSLNAVPILDEEFSCAYAEKPSLFSVISYPINNKQISYYGNKLPRKLGDPVSNFFAMIRGRIDAQATGKMLKEGDVLDTSGLVNIATVRNTINKNLSTLAKNNFAGGDDCVITDLSAAEATIPGCGEGADYLMFEIEDENILYFKNSEVALDLDSPDFEGKWSVVVEGGNIFVRGDVYNEDKDGKSLALVSFQDLGSFNKAEGNIYIDPCSAVSGGVKNLQAVMVADGTVFTYSGNPEDIDEDTGKPIWGSVNNPDFESYMEASSSCQLFVEGAIYSKNTIGGNDFSEDALMIGGGVLLEAPFTTAKKMEAQMYDLNYLRSYSAGLEFGDNGMAIDQNCGYTPTPEELISIEDGDIVCGEYTPCSLAEPDLACDGIDSTCFYTGTGSACDLVPPEDENVLSLGLDDPELGLAEEDMYWPTYVFYTPLDKDSILFSIKYPVTLQ